MSSEGGSSEPTLELLRGAHAGKRQDLEDLCDRVAPAVYAWARLRIRSAMRKRLDPDEVVQEVWLRVLAQVPDLDPEQLRFRPWVLGIARNVLFEMSRKTYAEDRARRGAGTGGAAGSDRWDSFFERQADPATGISTGAARRDLLDAFLERVERMGKVERKLLLMHGLEQQPFDQVGEALGISRDSAAKRWQRLRLRLIDEGVPPYLLEDE